MMRLYACLLLVSTLGFTAAAAAEEPVLFRLDGTDYNADSLPDGLALKLHQLEFEHHFKVLQLVDDAIFEAYVDSLVAASDGDRTATVAELLTVPPATDHEIEALYRSNQARINAPLDQVRERIALFVEGQRRVLRKRELVAALSEEGRLQQTLREPKPPLIEFALEAYPARGAEQPAVTVVEFADYQCPFCRTAGKVLEGLLADHPDRLRVVYVDFPVNPSGISRVVAHGAVCAAEQDRFWEYHDLAFERQRQLDAAAPDTLAAALQLDVAVFQSCMAEPRAEAQVARGAAEAMRLGLDSTPTLFINGRRLILQDIERELPLAVEAALAHAG